MDVLCIGETLVDIITRPVSNVFLTTIVQMYRRFC